MKIRKYFKSFQSILFINFVFFFSRFKKKKTILFFHPVDDLKKIHDFYLQKLSNNLGKNFIIINCHKSIKDFPQDNQFYISYLSLKFIFFCNIFISNNISDIFPPFSKKIYIHHSIYDTPLVDKKKEHEIERRLSKYDYIFISCKKVINVFENLFKNYTKPTLIEAGYLRFSFLISFISKNHNNKKIIIAPTGIDSFRSLSLKRNLSKIMYLLNKSNYFVILRPHPRDINKKFYQNLKKRNKNNKLFLFDDSNNYLETYNNSFLMITDLSGTAYTYAFLTKKPVIFFSRRENFVLKSDYKNLNYFKDRRLIGEIITDEKKIIFVMKKCLQKKNKIKKEILKLIKKNHLEVDSFKLTTSLLKKISNA